MPKVYLDDQGNPKAPGKVYLDDQGNPKAPGKPKVYLDENGEPRGRTFGESVKHGAGQGVGDWQAIGSLVDRNPRRPALAISPGQSAAESIVKGVGSQLWEGVKALPAVMGYLANPEHSAATWRGLREGATHGAVENATGSTVDEIKKDPVAATTRMLVGGAPFYAYPAARVVTGVARRAASPARKAARQAARREAAGNPTLIKEPLKESISDGIDSARSAERPSVTQSTLPQDLPQPEVSYPLGGGRRVNVDPDGRRTVSKAPPPAPKKEPGSRIVEPEGPDLAQSLREGIDEGIASARSAARPNKTVSTLPQTTAQPAVSFPRVQGRLVQTKRPGSRKPDEPRAEPRKSEPELPDAWKPFAGKPTPPAAGVVGGAGESRSLRGMAGETPTVAELRSALGSEEAARVLGISREEVKRLAPGPSRKPAVKEAADLDNRYRQLIDDERGGVNPKLALKLGLPVAGAAGGSMLDEENRVPGALLGVLAGLSAANPAGAAKVVKDLRMIGMMSGAATAKGALGALGSHLTDAAMRGTLKPIKEMLRLPTNTRNAVKAWKSQPGKVNPWTGNRGVSGLARFNVPGRLAGVIDEVSEKSLMRAGSPQARAKMLQLTTEDPVGAGSLLNRAFQGDIGQFAVPFQRIPFNSWGEGVMAMEGLLPKKGRHMDPIRAAEYQSGRGRALTAGAMVGGATAGSATEDPMTIALLAALAGVRGIPLAAGAGSAVTNPRSVLERVGVGLPDGSVHDLVNPLRPIENPALISFLKWLDGQK